MIKKKILFKFIIVALAVIEMVLAITVKGFADFYQRHIFPIWNATYGRVTGLFKFSIGEFFIYLSVLYVLFTIVVWIIRLVNVIKRNDSFKKLCGFNTNLFFNIIAIVILLQVQNCFMLYRVTPLFEDTEARDYVENREDLIDLREMLVKRANEMAEEFVRDKNGEIIFDVDYKSISIIAMSNLGETAKARVEAGEPEILDDRLQLLSGSYSEPKGLLKSDFFCQQSICGYYFPFSLEANYNKLMYVTNFPGTMCHELAHLQGFIFEDEANFISYLACINSGNTIFEYSATLDALAYVNIEVKRELAVEPEVRNTLTPISDKVIFDSMFITEETRAEVEKDAWFKTEDVKRLSDEFIDTNLTLNGVEDGIQSYSRMVDLLLKYYYCN